jgi:soluble lytic murein transglycosylase
MRFRRILGSWLLLPALLSFTAPQAPSPTPEPSAIVWNIQRGRYEVARDQLFRLLFSEVEPVWKRRAVYLLGHVHLKLGAYKEAAGYFERAREVLPAVSDYALYNQGLAEAGSGRIEEARRAFTALLGGEPGSRLHPHATFQRAEAAFAAEAWEVARLDYERLLGAWPAFKERPAANLRLGRMAEAGGDESRALASYRAAVLSGPAHQAAGEALERLDALRARLTPRQPLWSAEEALRLGRAWIAVGRPREALEAFEVALSRTRGALLRGRASLGAAKAEVAMGRRAGAAKRLGDLIRRSPRHPDAAEAHYEMGRALWNIDRRAEARTVLRRLLNQYRPSPFSEQAFYILGRLYAEQGWYARSAKAFRELDAAYPDGELAREGLWRMGWNAYSRGRFGEAAAAFRRALARLAPTDWEDEVLYWLARTDERSGRRTRALGRYRELSERYPHTYYGQQAAGRLNHLGESASGGRGELSPARAGPDLSHLSDTFPIEDMKASWRLERALELAAMGFRSDAKRELAKAEAALTRGRTPNPDLSLSLGALYHQAGLFELAIRRLNGPFAEMDPKEVLGLSRRFWELYYPRPFRELIERASADNGLESALVLGLIRQESAFRAGAVSPAGAVGLMQVLPVRRDKDGEALFDPEVNLARGTSHLAGLLKRYDGRLVDALVAYNAGVHRLKRWRRRFKGLDEDEFIEAIPFTETRTYVKRVLRNAALYRMLYAGEDAAAR